MASRVPFTGELRYSLRCVVHTLPYSALYTYSMYTSRTGIGMIVAARHSILACDYDAMPDPPRFGSVRLFSGEGGGGGGNPNLAGSM